MLSEAKKFRRFSSTRDNFPGIYERRKREKPHKSEKNPKKSQKIREAYCKHGKACCKVSARSEHGRPGTRNSDGRKREEPHEAEMNPKKCQNLRDSPEKCGEALRQVSGASEHGRIGLRKRRGGTGGDGRSLLFVAQVAQVPQVPALPWIIDYSGPSFVKRATSGVVGPLPSSIGRARGRRPRRGSTIPIVHHHPYKES